jgi:glycosyltransferase involved in cell wall biosynthesis
MKVSIITVCFNSEKYIRTAIESVISQTYQEIEYIIIDGGSIDGTIDIIKSYGGKISKFISEPDSGIYDAMNKGIKMATGDIVGVVNSDDLLAQNTSIEMVVDAFKNNSVDSVYSDIFYVKRDDTNSIVRYWQTGLFRPDLLKKGWHPAHVAFYVKRNIFDKYGLLDPDFHIAADFEIIIRFLGRYKISSYYLHHVLAKMRLGGVSSRNLKNIYMGNKECMRAFHKNNIEVSDLYPVYRLMSKIFQYVK